MNKLVNIAEILKNCKKGIKLYSPIFGEVEFIEVVKNFDKDEDCICVKTACSKNYFSEYGIFDYAELGECLLFPSKDQRDWTKFEVEKERFDPHTLQPFDRVLVRYTEMERWRADFFSYFYTANGKVMCQTIGSGPVSIAIPYNDDTKHLIGISDDCPEYYKWWKN